MRDFTIRPIANPHPEKWPGRWFAFSGGDSVGEGTAHESTLHLYVGEERAQAAVDAKCDNCGGKGWVDMGPCPVCEPEEAELTRRYDASG